LDNPEVLACSGRIIGFKRTSSNLSLIDCYSEHDNPENRVLPQSIFLRTIQYFSNYSSRYFYSVYRTESWKSIYTNFIGRKPLPRNYLELIIEFRACLKGSHSILDDVFWLRNFTNAPIRAEEKYRIFAKPNDYFAVMTEVFSNADLKRRWPLGVESIKSAVICFIILSMDFRSSLLALKNRFVHLISFRQFRVSEKEEIFELSVLLQKKNAVCDQLEITELLNLV
jgi:hypothetical protein